MFTVLKRLFPSGLKTKYRWGFHGCPRDRSNWVVFAIKYMYFDIVLQMQYTKSKWPENWVVHRFLQREVIWIRSIRLPRRILSILWIMQKRIINIQQVCCNLGILKFPLLKHWKCLHLAVLGLTKIYLFCHTKYMHSTRVLHRIFLV